MILAANCVSIVHPLNKKISSLYQYFEPWCVNQQTRSKVDNTQYKAESLPNTIHPSSVGKSYYMSEQKSDIAYTVFFLFFTCYVDYFYGFGLWPKRLQILTH